MKKLLIIAALVVAATAIGCNRSNDDASDDGAPVEPEFTVEETATRMLEALKTGDVDTFLAHTDVRGIYERFPEAMRKTFSYEYFLASLEKAKAKARDAESNDLKDLRYEIVGTEERDGFQVVTFRTQTRPDRSWKRWEAHYRLFDGTWKITGTGVKKVGTEKN